MLERSTFWSRILRNADGGAGAGAGDGGAPAGGGAASGAEHSPTAAAAKAAANGTAGADAKGAPAAGSAYLPEGLPEHFRGESDQDTIDRLFAAYKGAREDISKRGTVPKEASAYTFEPGEKAKGKIGDLKADPLFPHLQQAALKAGLTDKQFQTYMAEAAEMLASEEGGEPAFDPQAEIAKAGADGAKRFVAADAFVESFIKDAGLAEGPANELRYLVDTFDGLQALEALMKREPKAAGPELDGKSLEAGALTEAKVRELMADPRYDSLSPKYEESFRADADRRIQAFYTKRAAASG